MELFCILEILSHIVLAGGISVQNYNWDLRTQFVFPEELGIVEDVVSVDIKPRWQLIETEDCFRLVGIYHITSTVRFDPHELPEYSEGTLIEHLELNDNNGYFEYALPLEVNLPKEKLPAGSNPEITVDNIQHNVYDGSCATVSWDVCCTISEEAVEPQFEEVNQTFESYLESSSVPLEIPSATAFAEMIQEPNTEKLDLVEVSEEPFEAESDLENQLEERLDEVQIPEEAIFEESITNFFEPEEIILSSNDEEPEVEEIFVESQKENQQNDYVQTSNILQQQAKDAAFDDDDFFSNLSESYTLLNLNSNKVSPE